MRITGLNNLNLLGRIGRLERREQIIKHTEATMPVRIITETDNIKIGCIVPKRLVERDHVCHTTHLGMNNDLGSGTHLATSLNALLEIVRKILKGTVTVIGTTGVTMPCGP